MKIKTYRSNKKWNKHISVPIETDINSVLPKITDPDLTEVSLEKTREIDRGDSRAGMDADDIINQIEQNGYAIHGVSISTEVRTEPSN